MKYAPGLPKPGPIRRIGLQFRMRRFLDLRTADRDLHMLEQRISHHLRTLSEISKHRQAQQLKNLCFPYNLITRQEQSWTI